MTESTPWAWAWGHRCPELLHMLFKMASLQPKIMRGKETGNYCPCTGKNAGQRNCPEWAQVGVLSNDDLKTVIINIFKN